MTTAQISTSPFGSAPERRVRPFGTPLKNIHVIQLACVTTVIITLAIISRVGMIAWPFLNDSGLYAELGRTVANGNVMYRDFYETKLPGVGLLASAFWRAFGPHWAGYVLCQMVMAFLAAAALARIARRYISPTSRLPTFLFAIVFLNLCQVVYTGFQLETIQAFFESLAAMAAIEAVSDDDLFATFTAGLAAGMAAMAKPGGLGVAIALAIVLVWSGRRRLIHVATLVAGVGIPTGVTLFYTIRSGAWPYLPSAMRDIQQYATGTPLGVDAIVKVFVVLAVLGFPFLFRVRATIGGTPTLRMFVIAWFIMDLMAVLAQRRLYPYHFLPLACPAALLYGILSKNLKPPAITVGLLPIAMLSLTWEGSNISKLSGGFRHMAVSDYIADHTTANDSVFADQIGRLLIETDRKAGSRLGTFFYFVNDDDAPRRYCQTLLGDYESRKPKYLVLTDGWDRPVPALANCNILSQCPQRRENFIAAWAALRDYVAVHYHLESKMDGVLIYRRSDSFEHRQNP